MTSSGSLSRGGAEFTALKLLYQGTRVQRILSGQDCYPSQVDLSLTSECNLRCRWCVDSTLRKDAPGEWDTPRLLTVLEEYRRLGVEALVLDGGGEPTIHPDFSRIVTQTAAMGFHLGLVTNGLLLSAHSSVLSLFDWVRVSLDAPNADIYRVYKGVNGFDQVLSGISAAVDARTDDGGRPIVGVGYLTAREAVDRPRLQAITATIREMGASYIQVRRLSGCDQLDAGAVDLSFLQNEATPTFSVYVHQVDDYSVTGNYGVPCLAHRLVSVVSASGEVFFCRRLQSSEAGFIGSIGNLNESDVVDIWNGRARRSLVEAASVGEWCRSHCPQCRLSKYNLALNRLQHPNATPAFL